MVAIVVLMAGIQRPYRGFVCIFSLRSAGKELPSEIFLEKIGQITPEQGLSENPEDDKSVSSVRCLAAAIRPGRGRSGVDRCTTDAEE
jgi:hypothetical protein